MRIVWVMAAVLLVAAGAQAQTVIDSYDLKYFNAGATSPVQTESFPSTDAVCDQEDPSPGSSVNPTQVIWDDPDVAGRVCIRISSPGSVLPSLPIGNYDATLSAVNVAGASGDSNRAPFSVVGSPAAPSGLRLRK